MPKYSNKSKPHRKVRGGMVRHLRPTPGKYMPHQGKQEIERRRLRLEKP